MSTGLLRAILCVLVAAQQAASVENSQLGIKQRDLANEAVSDAILYGYVIDPSAPNYLGRGDVIFKVDRDSHVAISSNSDMTMNLEYSDSEHTASENIAASMKVSGHFGAFSGSASMSLSKTSNKNIKTVRLDSVIKAIKYEVGAKGAFKTFPETLLTDNFKKAVKHLNVKEIAERIGIFFATKLDLGGEIRKSYTMQATAEDNEMNVKAELQASYGNALMGASVEASGSYGTRTSNKESKMKMVWSAKGGDTTVWLGRNFDQGNGANSISSIQKEWAATFQDDNLYPANFELRPIWDMVKAVDAKKGTELQNYLVAKWNDQLSQFLPTEFLGLNCYNGTDPLQRDYRGSRNTTKDGLECQKWTSQTPHNHSRTANNYPGMGLGDHNLCRNPDSEPASVGAWCYTRDPGTRFTSCGIKPCPAKSPWPPGSYCILANGACPAGFTRRDGYMKSIKQYDVTSGYLKPVTMGDSKMKVHNRKSKDSDLYLTGCCIG